MADAFKEWEVLMGATPKSWNLIRYRTPTKSPYDYEPFMSAGAARPRRWPTRAAAQAFADKLNATPPASPSTGEPTP